jgi:hypothetical protein
MSERSLAALAVHRRSNPPFGRGNTAAVRHGAQATLALQPRAAEIADDLRLIVPAVSDADEPAIRVLALLLARLEAANAWLAERETIFANKRGEVWPVLKLVGSWENSATRLFDQLGLTPTARARLGVDLSRLRQGEALQAHLVERYGGAETMP